MTTSEIGIEFSLKTLVTTCYYFSAHCKLLRSLLSFPSVSFFMGPSFLLAIFSVYLAWYVFGWRGGGKLEKYFCRPFIVVYLSFCHFYIYAYNRFQRLPAPWVWKALINMMLSLFMVHFYCRQSVLRFVCWLLAIIQMYLFNSRGLAATNHFKSAICQQIFGQRAHSFWFVSQMLLVRVIIVAYIPG